MQELECQGHVYPPTSPLNSNETCLVPQGVIHQSYSSYAVWNTCPQNWTDRIVRQQCQDEDQNDLLRNLPVFDEDSEEHYRNVFCAKCNGATQKCIPKFQDCHYISPNSKKNGSYCQTECLRYAFPVCSQNIRFRNPQCALCNGFKLNDQDSGCEFDDYGTTPSLTILFDFTSTSKYIVHVKDWKNDVFKNTEKEFSCQTDEVFDPFVGNCKKIVSTRSQATNNTSDDDHLQGKHNESQNWNANCTVIAFNKTDFVQLSNGSIYLKPHNKLYNNMTYMLRDSKLLLCVNFSRNFSRTEKEGGKQTITKTPALLQLLSAIGCIVSMVSLVLLLITYIVFAELRNLPGKIIINLALSLLLYQSLFLSAVKTDDQDTCLAIAVLLHFFVLSSFTWMTVMAYDMRRIFTNISEGVVAHRQNQSGGYTKRLMNYCLYAWGSPVLFVVVCVITDHIKKGSIGYGQGEEECFISQLQALLYSFVLPVALLMIFNLIALGHTVVHIIKTRKRTQQQKNRRHDTSVAVICVKMASVMGVTWILGIAANLKALSFLWYPYVVLNSLQGLFIFLSFAASGKALELYKSKLAGILRNRTTQSEEDNRGNHNCNHTDENRHSRDTRL
ncbi:adhesion G protein-coupled receptor L4-like [Oculina patagonica]